MKSICGANCDNCELLKSKKCEGCLVTNGCPFGKECFISNYIKIGGKENFDVFKKELISEFNSLNIPGLKVENLYPLNGSSVNLEYLLPSGKKVKFLNDDEIYLGNEIECEFSDGEINKMFGIIANTNFLLVSEYDCGGLNAEIIVYKRR